MTKKKIMIFGAGKVGRSFIGQLFGRAGYELVFVDVDRRIIDLLNRERQYRVVFKSDYGDDEFVIRRVRGLYIDNAEAINNELTDSTISAVSVGQHGLPSLLPIIARTLASRMTHHDMLPLDIIIAENMRNAAPFIKERLVQLLPKNFPVDAMAGLVETSIGKMVPVMTTNDLINDPLQIFAEPYNTLIVDKHGFKNPIPQIESLAPKDNIKAWVDRKLFIHNLGHSAVAYLGNMALPEKIYLADLLNENDIYGKVRATMLESAAILMKLYPDAFTLNALTKHIDDLMRRFGNLALRDTVFRAGCDLCRKLGSNDRFAAPLRAALKLNMPHDNILVSMRAALAFQAKDHNGHHLASDERFFDAAKKGIEYVLQHISGFTCDEVGQLLANAKPN